MLKCCNWEYYLENVCADLRNDASSVDQTSYLIVLLQLGPNVTIGKNVVIGPGVRVRESLVLEDALIQVGVVCPVSLHDIHQGQRITRVLFHHSITCS